MFSLRFFMVALALFALAFVGCEREITGDVTAIVDNSAEDCLACHSGYLDQAQGEWANSIHASGNTVDYTNRGGSDCTRCHFQQGFLSFIETGTLPPDPFSTVSAIGCFTCHNPHENGDLSLRVTSAFTLLNGDVFNFPEAGNLCVQCHHSRTDVRTVGDNQSVNSRFGPHHGPQGDMIAGTNMYEFPGLSYTFPSSPHGNQVREACAGCHMGATQNHTGYNVGGHSFKMVDVASGETQIGICSDAACHPTADEFDFPADQDYDGDGVVEGYITEYHGMMDSLEVLLFAAGVVNASGTPLSGTIADGHLAGALFNFRAADEDQSEGIHNWNYISSLLLASIDYVEGVVSSSPGMVFIDDSATPASSH